MKTVTKSLVISATAVALLAGSARTAQADSGWATAGKVLTGVVAGSILTRALCPPEPAVVYTAPPTVVYTAPVVTAQPVIVQTQPAQQVVVQQPVQQVVVQPAPVVVYPAPPVVYAAPRVVYYRPCPPPVIGVGIHFGHHHHHCR